MDALKETATSLTHAVEQAVKTEQATLRDEVQVLGNPAKWLDGHAPRLAIGCPPELTEQDFVRESRAWYLGADRRLGLCAGCPPHGGACANDESALRVGRKPTWVGNELRAEPCDRYREYRVRRRLEQSGVPALYVDSSFRNFARFVETGELAKLTSIAADVLRGERPWIVLTGGLRTGKTRLGISVLRTLVVHAPRILLWYADVLTLRARMRQAWDDESRNGDLFENLRRSEFLVLDNVDPSRFAKEEWLSERIEEVLRDRRVNARSTIVCTREKLPALVKAFPTIPSLGDVTQCRLLS